MDEETVGWVPSLARHPPFGVWLEALPASFPHISFAISLNFPPPDRKLGPHTTIGFGKLVEPGHTRPTHTAVPHVILRRVSLRGNVQPPVPPFPTRTYDRGRERKSCGPRLTPRRIEISGTQDFWPLDDPP